MRREFEMTEDDLKKLLDASKPVPYMVFGGVEPLSPRENACAFWRNLGERMGFDWETAEPVMVRPTGGAEGSLRSTPPPGGGDRFFTAEEKAVEDHHP